MKKIILLLFIFSVSYSFSQERKQTDVELKFSLDVQNNQILLYYISGFAGKIDKNVLEFCKVNNILIHDFGCIPPSNFKFHEKYNQLVFQFLKENVKSRWEKDFTDNFIGFSKWKQNN